MQSGRQALISTAGLEEEWGTGAESRATYTKGMGVWSSEGWELGTWMALHICLGVRGGAKMKAGEQLWSAGLHLGCSQ